MPDTFEQLKELKQIKLEDDTKARMRERISLYASLKPSAHTHQVRQYERVRFSAFFSSRMSKVLATSLVIVIAGVSSISAAEGTIPGDLLYPVKVHVNEEVRALFALSSQSKAELEVSRLTRRLEEAEQLAVQGKLSAEAESELAERIGTHSRAARGHIAESERAGEALAVQRVEATLISTIAAHDGVITDLAAARISQLQEDDEPASLETVRSVLQAEIVAAASSTTEVLEPAEDDSLRDRQIALGQALVELEHTIEESDLLGDATRSQALRLFGQVLLANTDAKQALRDGGADAAFAAILRGEQSLDELETLMAVGAILKGSFDTTENEEVSVEAPEE